MLLINFYFLSINSIKTHKMNKSSDKIPTNHNRLPSLHKSTSKLIPKYQNKIPQLSFSQKPASQFQQHPKNINQVKAHNFLNHTSLISSPSVIFNLSDCVKKQYGKKFQNSTQFSEDNFLKSPYSKNFQPQKENQMNKSLNFSNLTQQSFHQNDKKLSFQRQQVLKLAQWIEQKLEHFNKKKEITVDQIIDYKQHIINYGLGRIIDNIKKKSKQQGELLKILWQNSFKIFEKVLQIVSNYICNKQQSYLNEQKQTKGIFDMNMEYLKKQNEKINFQLGGVYEKMKRVIVWNKKLRKQRKQLNVQNRILQYRNETYAQALQDTISMLLKAVPEPSTISFSKKIIEKLARQKRRKRKTIEINEAQQDFQLQAKQMVMKWLKRNGFNDEVDDDDINPLMYLTNDERLEMTKIDDQNNIDHVDIYEYFKLLDIGVQTDKQNKKDTQCQYDIDTSVKTHSRGVITQCLLKKHVQVQVLLKQITPQKQPIVIKRSQNKKNTGKFNRQSEKKKSNASKFSQKVDKVKEKSLSKQQSNRQKQKIDLKQIPQEESSKFSKVVKIRAKQSLKSYKKKQQDKQSTFVRMKTDPSSKSIVLPSQKENKFYEKDFTIISEKKTEEFSFQSDQEVKNWNISDQYKISISKLNEETNKVNVNSVGRNGYYEKLMGRQISIQDFADPNQPDQSFGTENYDNNLKKIWQQMKNQKINDSQARNSRMSMNFIKIDNQNYSMKKLQRKSFNQVYDDDNINSRSNEKEREKLFQNVVRRRSFYKKRKVMFQNSNDFQQMKETEANLYKSYIHYKPHNNRTIIEIQQEQQQKVSQISKMMGIPSNLAKSKTLQASKQIFKSISQACKKTKKQPPKNKQYFNSSLISITKNVTALIQDYVRQIKRQKDQIQTDFQKSYYPLYTILIDKMNWKYGLKDISEKKIKDFLQKILTFAQVSEKVSLYSLLFGMQVQGVSADELLIYLKSLVYFEKKQPLSNSIHIIKQVNVFEKTATDWQTVEENLDKVLKEFFDQQGSEIAKQQVLKYMDQSPKTISIQKISQILIRVFLKRKQLYRKDCQFLYKLSNKGNNIYNNLYKILKIYNNYNTHFKDQIKSTQKSKVGKIQKKRAQINISTTLKEFVKRSDVIDEIYGKSISFDRFLTAFMICRLPKSEQFTKIFNDVMTQFGQKYCELSQLKKLSLKPPKQSLKRFCQQNVKFLQEIQRKWQIKTTQKTDQQTWQWNVTKTVTEHVETNLKSVLGKLDLINNQIDNFFFSIENKTQSALINTKQ